jgi:hypothetical protein
MTSLANKINSGIGHFVQDCKELKNYSQMERGEFTKRIASIGLRISAIAVGAYCTYKSINALTLIPSYLKNSNEYTIGVSRKFCEDLVSTCDTDHSKTHQDYCDFMNAYHVVNDCRDGMDNETLFKAAGVVDVIVMSALITIIPSAVLFKINSMIATKPDCKSVYQHR